MAIRKESGWHNLLAAGPSQHFAWSEFACHDHLHTTYPLDWRTSRGTPLAKELERVRATVCFRVGRDTPLYLDSVYRTLSHNTAVGGRPKSQHLEGRAADVRCPFGCSFHVFEECVLSVASDDSLIRYVKIYPNQGFIHMDIRPGGSLVVERDG